MEWAILPMALVLALLWGGSMVAIQFDAQRRGAHPVSALMVALMLSFLPFGIAWFVWRGFRDDLMRAFVGKGQNPR